MPPRNSFTIVQEIFLADSFLELFAFFINDGSCPLKYRQRYKDDSDILCMKIFDELFHVGKELSVDFEGVETFSPERINIDCADWDPIYFKRIGTLLVGFYQIDDFGLILISGIDPDEVIVSPLGIGSCFVLSLH